MRKKHQKLQLSLLLVLTCISLTACGGGTSTSQSHYNSSSSGSDVYFEADSDSLSFSSADTSAFGLSFNSSKDSGKVNKAETTQNNSQKTQDLKLIRTVSMELEVDTDKQLKPTVDDLMDRTNQLGGYTSYNNIDAYSYRASANLELKVPKNQVDAFLNDVDDSYSVTSMSDRSEDVTSKYIDVESRLKVKETAKEKYTSYLESAMNVTELLEIEDRLNDTIEDIESSKALLKSLDNRVDYTEISVSIRCKDVSYEPSYFEEAKEELGEIFEECGDTLIYGFGWLLQALIICLYSFPILYIVIRFILFCFGGKISLKGMLKKIKKNRKSESTKRPEEIK